jgi:hypothetical protein
MNPISKHFLLSVLFALIVINMTACSDSNPASNANADERKAKEEQDKQARNKSIADFVATNYKGFEIKGTAGGGENEACGDGELCELHLVKGDENKVITVVVKKFQQNDGTSYWFVYEPTKLDLSQLRINALKEKYEEQGRQDEQEYQQQLEDEQAQAREDDYPY